MDKRTLERMERDFIRFNPWRVNKDQSFRMVFAVSEERDSHWSLEQDYREIFLEASEKF